MPEPMTNDELFVALAFLVHQPGRSMELGLFMSRFHVVFPSSRIFAEGYASAGDPLRSPCLVTLTEKGLLFYDHQKKSREQNALQQSLHRQADQTQRELARKESRLSWLQTLLPWYVHRLFLLLGLIFVLLVACRP